MRERGVEVAGGTSLAGREPDSAYSHGRKSPAFFLISPSTRKFPLPVESVSWG